MIFSDSHIEKIASGDRVAFGQFHELMYERLFFYAKKFLDDVGESEDFVQDVFIQYWEKRDNFNNVLAVRAYLYTLLQNKIRNRIRKRQRQSKINKEIPIEELSDGEHIIISAEIAAQVRQAINELPTRTKEVMELGLLGMGVEDIAKEMSVSVNTIKTLKKGGYKKLRTSLYHLKTILPLLLLS